MKTVAETRQRILEAAEQRFSHYGFGKTTMAEIAKDCDMSAANIYRFFNSKKEILAGIASLFFRQTETVLHELIRSKGLTATTRLERFIRTMLHNTHSLFANKPKINEAVDLICQERLDLVMAHKEKKISFVAEILAEGNRTGEFDVHDIVATAETVIKATVIFHTPFFMCIYPLEQLEQDASRVTSLILKGLNKR